MNTLHIIQGGIENGDKAWLERAARKQLSIDSWVVPKSASPGDDVVIYIAGYGFFATAKITSIPKHRKDRPNRYGAGLTSIKLIEPAISIGAISKNLPRLNWANYPRSITTPTTNLATKIRKIIEKRRKTGILDIDVTVLSESNIDELRKVAIMKSRSSATQTERKTVYRARSEAIKLYVLKRSNGICEGCKKPAPFLKMDGTPYLEPHHTLRLADDGPDHPNAVIALCPNCHKRAHHAADFDKFNKSLIKTLTIIEKRVEK